MTNDKIKQLNQQLLAKGVRISTDAVDLKNNQSSRLSDQLLNEIEGPYGACGHTNHSAHSNFSKSK